MSKYKDNGGPDQAPGGIWAPTSEWQDVPEGVGLPPGCHYRIDPNTGLKQARRINFPSPDLSSGAFTKTPFANGAYVNSQFSSARSPAQEAEAFYFAAPGETSPFSLSPRPDPTWVSSGVNSASVAYDVFTPVPGAAPEPTPKPEPERTPEPETVTVLYAVGNNPATGKPFILTKRWWSQGGKATCSQYDEAWRFDHSIDGFRDLEGLSKIIVRASAEPNACLVWGRLRADAIIDTTRGKFEYSGLVWRLKRPSPAKDGKKARPPCFEDTSRRWLPIDIEGEDVRGDKLPPDLNLVDGDAVARWVRDKKLPPEFRGRQCFWQLTSSAGIKKEAKIRLFFWLDRAIYGDEATAWLKKVHGRVLDVAIYRVVQPIYIAKPIFEGMEDPVTRRAGMVEGDATVAVPEITIKRIDTSGEDPSDFEPLGGDLNTILAEWLKRVNENRLPRNDTFYFEVMRDLILNGLTEDRVEWAARTYFNKVYEKPDNPITFDELLATARSAWEGREDTRAYQRARQRREQAEHQEEKGGDRYNWITDLVSAAHLPELRRYRDDWFTWNGHQYQELSKDGFEAKLTRFLIDRGWSIDTKAFAVRKRTVLAFRYLDDQGDAPLWIEPRPALPVAECIVFRNAVVHVPSGTVEPVTPALFTLNAVSYDYDPKAPTPERWLAFLDQVFEGDQDAIGLLQEWFGYCMTADTSMQKALLLIGRRRGQGDH